MQSVGWARSELLSLVFPSFFPLYAERVESEFSFQESLGCAPTVGASQTGKELHCRGIRSVLLSHYETLRSRMQYEEKRLAEKMS